MRRWINILITGILHFVFWCVPTHAEADGDDFEFVLHDGLLPTNVQHLNDALIAHYGHVLDALEIARHPTVTVQVWSDEEAYQTAMFDALGMRAPGSRGYITGPQEIRLLLHTKSTAQREAVHEFVHAASLMVNPSFGNNPRWLWEAVAQYVAGERVDPKISPVFADGTCPTLKTLNSAFDRGGSIYVSGYLLGDFIATSWGASALPQLIRLNGDTKAVLGLDDTQFETAWCEYVQSRYMQ